LEQNLFGFVRPKIVVMYTVLGVHTTNYPLQPLVVLRWFIRTCAPYNYARSHQCWRILYAGAVYGVERLCPIDYARICECRLAVTFLEVITYDCYSVVHIPEVVRRRFVRSPNSGSDR